MPTIAAIATAPGEAAIGIVRLSGPDAFAIAGRLFHASAGRQVGDLPSHTVHLGEIRDPHTGETVDQVLLTLFRAPRSYTGEDVVEIAGHGGAVPLRRILTMLLAQGARPAEPGEFTCRAFLNGKMDLAQAEAVIDVIQARTDRGLDVAVRQLEGRLSTLVRDARDALMPLLAHIEATIDFPEDVPEMDPAEIRTQIDTALAVVERLLAGAHAGRIYREGARVVIAGRPNVGKSSLLNALLREDRAIVTAVPGTTRDVIEESANIRGIPIRTIDTAGIRESHDVVEALGVLRSRDQVAAADLVLVVLDASEPPAAADHDVLALTAGRPAVLVMNKCDLPARLGLADLAPEWAGRPAARVSARAGAGIAELETLIADAILGAGAAPGGEALVSSARHQAALESARDGLLRAREAVSTGLPLEFATTDLRDALQALGQITGESVSEGVIAEIFGRFCIGK